MQAPKRFKDAASQLHEAAVAATGMEDFGERGYLVGLRVLLSALDENADRPQAAREFCWGTLVGCLIGRLYAVRGWREHPGALRRPVVAPIVITGIPRTGTTALHKLLSVDSQFQGLEMWLTNFPMPRPARDTWASNPEFRSMQATLAKFYESVPQMKAMHNMVAEEVDECLEVLKHEFTSNRFGSTFRLPAYDEWWLTQDELDSYRYYAKVVQLVGANDPDKRWLLKNPGHVWNLDALLEVFPDACIVQTHRDPAKAVGSVCSTLEATRPLGEGVCADPHELGQRESALWSEAMRRTMDVRKRRPANFFDVDHRDFHANPLAVVRRIYERFGFTLDAPTEQKMSDRIRINPEGSHGTHEYTLEHYGLTRAKVNEDFAEYAAMFGPFR